MLPYFVIAAAIVFMVLVVIGANKMLPPYETKDDLGFLAESIGVLNDTSKK